MTKFLIILAIILTIFIVNIIKGNFIDTSNIIKNFPENTWEFFSSKYSQFIEVKEENILYLNNRPVGKVENVIVDEKQNLITFEKILFNDSEIMDLLMLKNSSLQFRKYEIRLISIINAIRYPPIYKNVKGLIIKK